MKYHYLLFVIILLLSCNKSEQHKERYLNLKAKSGSEHLGKSFEFNDSLLNIIIVMNSNWFDSINWQTEQLQAGDFSLIDCDDKKYQWINCDTTVYHNFKKYLIKSDSNEYLDIYRYRTIFEKRNDTDYVSFDVDTKINIVNHKLDQIIELGLYGPQQAIEEGFWLDNNTVVILGIIFASDDFARPYIQFFDLKNYVSCYYEFRNKLPADIRTIDYFFQKFPDLFPNT